VFRPFFTGFTLFAIPAKFNSFFLQGTRNKRATGTHSGFGFTSTALACTFSMVMRAKSAGKPANTDFWVFNCHCYPFFRIITSIFETNGSLAADSKNYSPEMKSTFSAGGCTPTSPAIVKSEGESGGKKSLPYYIPIPVIIPTTC